MIPPEIIELARLVGVPAVVLLLIILRDWLSSRSDAKKDDAMTTFTVDFNAERKLAQERERAAEEREREQQQKNNHLYSELSDLKSKFAYEAGRRDEIMAGVERERTEWNTKNTALEDKIRVLQAEVLELQKNDHAKQEQIKELNTQIEILNKRIEDKDGEIVSLKATKLQLETEKAQLLELNTELRKQVDERNARIDNLSMLNQLKQEADLPPTPQADNPITDATQAIPDMRDVDDTIHPLPETSTDDKKIA